MAQPLWNTAAGSLGSFAALLYTEYQLSASPILPAVSVTYQIISGTLPIGLSMSVDGLISGTPTLVPENQTVTFVVRAIDNLNNIRDRTFEITVSGSAIPSFTTPTGTLFNVNDSIWISYQIGVSNPDPNNQYTVSVSEGVLPPGLEINERGLIRGYPAPPVVNVTLPPASTTATATNSSNQITCISTSGFQINRPIIFTGTTFGNIISGTTYYVKSILNGTTFTISSTQNGPAFGLTDDSGVMSVTLPAVGTGQPAIRTYSFTLKLNSALGGDVEAYSIVITNQNTPISQGGPGLPINTRIPAIYNTRPPTFEIADSPNFGYYVLPPDGTPNTYPINTPAFIGTINSDNYFSFKLLGHDFDGSLLSYSYVDMPFWLTGDPSTGWITGTPTLSSSGINQYQFKVSAYKTNNSTIQSPFITFSLNVAKDVNADIVWSTPSDLGNIFNGSISTKNVMAIADVELSYRLTSGSLPPNLTLLSNGEITGYVSNQPTNEILPLNGSTDFEFTIEAYSELYPIISSQKTFKLTVVQEFNQPTDILYIKAAPSVRDRIILDSLLNNETLIPNEMLYRPTDPYFGKASHVIYEHAYGIYASDIEEYIAAVTRNHYWRNITLGSIKTAVAKDDSGNVIYEVVYSQIVDDLVNPEGTSVSESVYWETPINLFLGPWYTSVTDIYTSYSSILGQDFYTSLTPGFARTLYPNSLFNMRTRVAQVLGQEYDSRLLPQWMTSQQADGSTLGFTQAWVICYTKPGYSKIIQNNINTLWKKPEGTLYKLNEINFKIDRFSVNKEITYNYDKKFTPPAWTGLPSSTPSPDPLDSKDFYVLFPRKTILPDETQY